MKREGEPVAAASVLMPLTGGLSQLFGEHHRRVLRAAYRITGSMADAEDVMQTVFLRLASVEGPVENAGSYLYRAAINGALDLLRRRKAAATEPLEDAADRRLVRPGKFAGSGSVKQGTRRLLRLRSANCLRRAAEMFTLRYFEDMGNREIAALMGTSQAVVAVTLHQRAIEIEETTYRIRMGKTMRTR